MYCPYCHSSQIKVIDSRHIDQDNSIKRRRECLDCGRRFSSYEIIQDATLVVIKKDNTREFFDKNKVLQGIMRSCRKRPVLTQQMEDIVNEVERELLVKYDKEVPSKEIGELVTRKLKDLDIVSYVRFASVYKEFQDLNSFFEELNKIKKEEDEKQGKEEKQDQP